MKKVGFLFVIGLMLVAIPVTIFLVNQNTELRKRAAPATSLAFSPAVVSKKVGDTFSVDVTIDTGANQVVAAELHVTFDPAILEAQTITNGAAFPNILASGVVDHGTASITVGAPSSTQPVTGTGTVATIKFKAVGATATGTTSKISLANNTFVGGLGEGSTNVLTGSTPATVTISSSSTTTTSTGLSQYATTIDVDKPISYWRLGESTGTTAKDTEDTNNGTIKTGVTLGTPGAISGDTNTAMTFDGTKGFISIADKTNIDIKNDLTVEAWAKPSNTSALAMTVADKGGDQYRLDLLKGKWRGVTFFNSTPYVASSSATTSTSQWTYLVMARQAGTLTLYINGAVASASAVPTGSLKTGTGVFAIGRSGAASQNFFGGGIDEVAVYNKALTAAQVLAHYQAGQPTATPAPTSSLTPTPSPTTAASASSSATPTTVSIASPASNESVSSSQPTISGKAKPGSTVTITVYSTPQTTVVTADSNGNWSFTPSTPLTTGPHTIVATATDPSGGTQTTTVAFVVAGAGGGGGTAGTQSAQPVTGVSDVTYILLGVAALFILSGIFVPLAIR